MSAEPAILVIGAGGQMTSRTVRALSRRQRGLQFILADISEQAAKRTAAEMPGETFKTQALDLYDANALETAVGAADFVVHGAGPFHKTAGLVRAACIKAGTDYMDIDDDVESSLQAITLDQTARSANVALYVGCGASPGLTNILARQAIDLLDEVDDVEVAWCTADEQDMEVGRAVMEHTMHIGAGDCVSWKNGQRVCRQSFVDTTVFPMGPALGPTRLYECAHPETVAIPHTYPHLNSVTCWGGMSPVPISGILKGVAQAERNGNISMDEACDFFKDVIEGRNGQVKVWRYALGGAISQLRRGETRLGELADFLWRQIRGLDTEQKMGIAARAVGQLDGRPAEVSIVTNDHAPGSALDTMEAATGLSQAAFLELAIEARQTRVPGCRFAEAWADPTRFLSKLTDLGNRPSAQLLCEPRVRFLA